MLIYTRLDEIKLELKMIFSIIYRFFLQWAGHCISKKPLDKDYLYESVSQLYLNKPGNA